MENVTFTRSRLYKINDEAQVEQKNWPVVRRLIGYDRDNPKEALDHLNRVCQLVRSYVNLFQQVMQLQHKTWLHKVYDTASTPYRRLLDGGCCRRNSGRQQGDCAIVTEDPVPQQPSPADFQPI